MMHCSSFGNRPAWQQSLFKQRRFELELILLCVRWHYRHQPSYRNVKEIMGESGLWIMSLSSDEFSDARSTIKAILY